MILSLQNFAYLLILTGLGAVFIPNNMLSGGILLIGGLILAHREHQKNKRKSNWEKHTSKRPGENYDKEQNKKRRDKNKKYKKKPNPNKRKNNE